MVDGNTEAVFVTLYNDIATGGVPDFSKNNSWEHGIRPSNAMGGGGKTPSAMMVDMFPMADGKRPSTCNTYTTLEQSSVAYDKNVPQIILIPCIRIIIACILRITTESQAYSGESKCPIKTRITIGKWNILIISNRRLL